MPNAATSLYCDGEVAGPERLDQAEHEAAQHGARDRADAAQHRRGERLDPGEEADEEVDHAVVERGHQAGDRGQRRAHDEGERDRAVDIDAAQAGHLQVLLAGALRAAERRACDQVGEGQHQGRASAG